MHLGRDLGNLLVALLVGAPESASAAGDICNVEAPKVVAVGDVHGAYDNFVEVLQMAGLVDEEIAEDGTMTALYPDTREALSLPAAEPLSAPVDQAVAGRP